MIGTLFGKTENNKNGKKDSYQSRIPEELLSEKKSRKQKYQNMRRIFNSF